MLVFLRCYRHSGGTFLRHHWYVYARSTPGDQPAYRPAGFLAEISAVDCGECGYGGILLSLISSIAGLSLGIGTMISRDILPHAKESGTLLRTRMVVLAVILLAAIVAVMNKDSQVLL